MTPSDKRVATVQCLKIRKKEPAPEFTLKITWNNGISEERTRTHQNVVDFLRIIDKLSNVDPLPELKDAQWFLPTGLFPLRGDKRRQEIDRFFQELIKILPSDILSDGNFVGFFEVLSISELKTKYSKILEGASQKSETRDEFLAGVTTNSKANTVRICKTRYEEIEEKYSSLNLNPNDLSSSLPSETYDLPEDFFLKRDTLFPAVSRENSKKVRNWNAEENTGDAADDILKKNNRSGTEHERKRNNEINTAGKLEEPGDHYTGVIEVLGIESYLAVNSNEISIDKGQPAHLIGEEAHGWWRVKVGDKEGLAPGKCLGVVKLTQPLMVTESKTSCPVRKDLSELYTLVEKCHSGSHLSAPLNAVDRLPRYENVHEIRNLNSSPANDATCDEISSPMPSSKPSQNIKGHNSPRTGNLIPEAKSSSMNNPVQAVVTSIVDSTENNVTSKRIDLVAKDHLDKHGLILKCNSRNVETDRNKPPKPPKPAQKPKPPISAKPKHISGNKEVTESLDEKIQIHQISRVKAEELLGCPAAQGTFLFRNRENSKSGMILSVFDGLNVRHFNVEKTTEWKLCVGNSTFNSVDEISRHFKFHPLSKRLLLSRQLSIK